MAVCNFLAPNGRPSSLYAGLSALLGDSLATHGWYQLRSPKFLNITGDWIASPLKSQIILDENGEPKLADALRLLGLGSTAHLTQHQQFANRWRLSAVPGRFTEYFGNRSLAVKMHEQLKVSGHLYNLLNIRYNATTARIEIIPKQVKVVYKAAPSTVEEIDPENAVELRAQIEKARAKALADITKPLVAMQFIEDSAIMNMKVQQPVEVEGTGEQMTREIGVGKWQAQIKKEYEILKKLVNCI
jgi:hypothetical protein